MPAGFVVVCAFSTGVIETMRFLWVCRGAGWSRAIGAVGKTGFFIWYTCEVERHDQLRYHDIYLRKWPYAPRASKSFRGEIGAVGQVEDGFLRVRGAVKKAIWTLEFEVAMMGFVDRRFLVALVQRRDYVSIRLYLRMASEKGAGLSQLIKGCKDATGIVLAHAGVS